MKGTFFHNAALLSGAELIARLKGLVFLPILTRHLGTADFGSWTQLSILVALVLPVMMLSSESGAIRFLSGSDRNEAARRFTGWLMFLAVTGTVASLLLTIFSESVAHFVFKGGGPSWIVFVAIGSVWINGYIATARTWLRIHNSAAALAITTVLHALTSLIALTIALLANVNVEEIIIYLLLGDAAALAVFAFIIWKDGALASPDLSWLGKMVSFSVPLIPAGYAYLGTSYLDRMFIVHYQGLEAVGSYALVYGLAYIVIQVVVSPLWAMFPNLATAEYNKGNFTAVQSHFERSAGAIFLIGVPAVAGSFIVAEDLVRLVAGDAYVAAAPALPWLLAGYLLLMLTAYYDIAAGLRGQPILSTYGLFIGFAVNLALNVALIPKHGMMGAAWATAAAFLTQFVYMYSRRYSNTLLSINPAFVLKTIAISASMAATLWLVKPMFSLPLIATLLINLIVGCILYVAGALSFRLVPRSYLSREDGLPQR